MGTIQTRTCEDCGTQVEVTPFVAPRYCRACERDREYPLCSCGTRTDIRGGTQCYDCRHGLSEPLPQSTRIHARCPYYTADQGCPLHGETCAPDHDVDNTPEHNTEGSW